MRNEKWETGKRTRALWAAALCVVVAMAVGCNTSPNVMVGQSGDTTLVGHITIADRGLQRDLELARALARDVNGLLVASPVIRSHVSTTREFEYIFRWYDADGIEIPDPKSHWTLDRIQGHEEKQVQATAPNEDAKSFKLMIRRPQPIRR